MADMNVSWGMTADGAFTALAELEAEVVASAQRQAMAAKSSAGLIDAELARVAKNGMGNVAAGGGRMEQATKSLEKSMFSVGNVGKAAFGGIAAAVVIGTKALDEAAKINSQVASEWEKLGKSGTGMLQDIGRDLAPLISGFSTMIEFAREARNVVTDAMSDAATGHLPGLKNDGESAKDFRDANRMIEEQDRQVKVREQMSRRERDKKIFDAEAEGKLVEAARLKGVNQRQDAAKKLDPSMTVDERNKAMALEDAQIAKSIELAKKKEEQAKADAAAQKQRAREALDDEVRALELQRKRAEGKTLEAEIDEHVAASNKKRREIAADTTMTDDEKKAAYVRVATAYDELSKATVNDALNKEAKKKSERDAELKYRSDALELEIAGYGIDVMRLEGRKKEAELAALDLETRKRILDIQRDENLTQDQKDRATQRIQDLAGREAAAIEARKDPSAKSTFRSISAGLLGGAALEAIVFGGGRSDGKADLMYKAEVDQVKLLSEISDTLKNQERTVVLA